MTRPGASAGRAVAEWNRCDAAFRRQARYRWGAEYEPAIKAVKGEAPPGSSPLAFFSRRLGRTMHALSIGEATFIALALYHPLVWDIHEQHVLHPYPADHPLAAHPLHRHQPWPSTTGTLRILDAMGRLHGHPRVTKPAVSRGVDPNLAPPDRVLMKPWIGDLLIFLKDDRGQYAVEWDVKAESGKHGKPWAGNWRQSNSPRSIAGAELREAAYQAYMAELRIPIRRVARDQIDSDVQNNLIRLCGRSQIPLDLPAAQVLEVECALHEALVTGETPARAIRRVAANEHFLMASLSVLERSVWERKLRVDLRHPILIDRPLRPEVHDLIAVHAALFER